MATLYTWAAIVSVVLNLILIILDLVLVGVFYSQLNDDYNLLESQQVCPKNSAPLCCSSVDSCDLHPANATTCVKNAGLDLGFSCCVRSDELKLFFLFAALVFVILFVQLCDLVTKCIFIARSKVHVVARLWGGLLAVCNLCIAVGIAALSTVTRGVAAPDCYTDTSTQQALSSAINNYNKFFVVAIAEVSLCGILFVIEFLMTFNIIKYKGEEEVEPSPPVTQTPRQAPSRDAPLPPPRV
eukprot:m.363599 g.363599  ORF g.363599 m.363599 type:complete len:241 (+) comp23094_c0_seq1:73-795(+)